MNSHSSQVERVRCSLLKVSQQIELSYNKFKPENFGEYKFPEIFGDASHYSY